MAVHNLNSIVSRHIDAAEDYSGGVRADHLEKAARILLREYVEELDEMGWSMDHINDALKEMMEEVSSD